MNPKKNFIFLSFLLSLALIGCAARRLPLLSLTDYSPNELKTLFNSKSQTWLEIRQLKALFKVKIIALRHKEYFRGAFYFQQPNLARFERWGLMNQLEGTAYIKGEETVVEIPAKNLYLIGSSQDFASQLWGEDILLNELPAILTAQPPNWRETEVQLTRYGKYLVLNYPDSRFYLGLDAKTEEVAYLAKLDLSGQKLWEVFYTEPRDFNGIRLMSQAKLQVNSHLTVEFYLEKFHLNPSLKADLFEINLPPHSNIESLEGALAW